MSLGRTISALCPVIPGGLLIFFPSYFIMNKCKATWQEEVRILYRQALEFLSLNCQDWYFSAFLKLRFNVEDPF